MSYGEFDPETDYDARKPTSFTLPEIERVIGYKAVLPLTDRFVRAIQSDAGAYVMFEVDQRWGFDPPIRLGMDLEAFRGVEP